MTDTDTGGWLIAEQAVYVARSSAMGPMRAGNLPAFGSAYAAPYLVRQRGGRVLGWTEVDAALLHALAPLRDGGAHPAH